MATFVVRRLASMLLTLFMISIVSFAAIQLPPGDVLTSWVTRQEVQSGAAMPRESLEALRAQYGLGEPLPLQYAKWVSGFPRGDFGLSLSYGGVSVDQLVGRRLGMTYFLVIATLIISWGLAIPFGIYAATHKNSFPDYLLSAVSFVGISIPNFLLAILYIFVAVFLLKGNTVGGLYSSQYIDAPWTWDKVVDFLRHLPVPLFILGLGGMAGTFRIMRANLLDILDQQYVETARAKGLAERVVIYKHAARIAINPLISRLGMQLPVLVSGTIILSIVLDLPTLGPLFYTALREQDMYLAGTILMILAVTLVVGNFIADLLLAWSDPRIRLG
jgi:peptide/nickel transport system permease protein